MISPHNQPSNAVSSDDDFTTLQYRELLRLAKRTYSFALYGAIPWKERFILWRHDCDYSLSRARALAVIEQAEGVRATYFLNPHCEFYNLFERSQWQIVKDIVAMGHEVGLHFDAAFHAIKGAAELDERVLHEAALLQQLFGIRPAAFSFHNPVGAHLDCDAETYGGLINCYSRRFKTEVSYCSDSNGYWRFRRLHDVLSQSSDPCIQVLTHPGWWQETAMPPRQRIFRSAYGRARATMRHYDAGLESYSRQNHAGAAQAIRFLQPINPRLFELCDLLWNTDQLPTLFLELWRLHESQINRLCKAVFSKQWQVPVREVNAFFGEAGVTVDGWQLFQPVFDIRWQDAIGSRDDVHKQWVAVRNQLVHGRCSIESRRLEEGCVYLCGVLEALATWGRTQPIGYDGLATLGSIGVPTHKPAEGSLMEELEEAVGDMAAFLNSNEKRRRWGHFVEQMQRMRSDIGAKSQGTECG